MGLPKVNKFLCCATLETGGLVIGWFYAIISLLIIVITISTVLLTYYTYLQPDGTFDDFYQTVLVVLIVIGSIYVIYFLILFVASVLLIVAVKKRDHNNMMMFMVLMVVGIIISFLQIFTVGYGGIVLAIFGVVINVYIFLCIYSVYDLFRNEKLGLTGPGSMAPGTQHTVVYMNQPQVGIPPQPYQNQRQYMQQTTTYVQQPAAFSQSQFPAYPQQTSAYPQENPPLYAQQAHIQAETQVTTSTINQKTDL